MPVGQLLSGSGGVFTPAFDAFDVKISDHVVLSWSFDLCGLKTQFSRARNVLNKYMTLTAQSL